MPEIVLIKTASGALMPATEGEADKLRRYKIGATMRANIAEMRNGKFFRKWWILATLAYNLWTELSEMPEHKGQRVQPNFERFRKDLTILAGHCHVVVNIRLETRLEADSLKWSEMTDETFEKLYSATIDAILGKVLAGHGFTEARIREMADSVMEFA
jgi:Protein of unknown function (DUF1367)